MPIQVTSMPKNTCPPSCSHTLTTAAHSQAQRRTGTNEITNLSEKGSLTLTRTYGTILVYDAVAIRYNQVSHRRIEVSHRLRINIFISVFVCPIKQDRTTRMVTKREQSEKIVNQAHKRKETAIVARAEENSLARIDESTPQQMQHADA